MRIFSWTIQRNSDLTVRKSLEVTRETLHRLEIEHRELKDYVSQLAGHHLKLRKQFDGSKGGRPVSRSETLPLDQIPVGDKAALRRALGVVPGNRYSHTEE